MQSKYCFLRGRINLQEVFINFENREDELFFVEKVVKFCDESIFENSPDTTLEKVAENLLNLHEKGEIELLLIHNLIYSKTDDAEWICRSDTGREIQECLQVKLR